VITCDGCKGLGARRDLQEKEILQVYCKMRKPVEVFHCIDKPVGAKPLQECKGVHTWAEYYEQIGGRK
jgi:hypothetical protein